MSTYTQITRNEDGEYIRETKKSPETFYLVEYATHATYYKVDANSYEDACDLIAYGNTDEGIVSIDRSDVFIDYTDKDIYDMIKGKQVWRKMVDAIDLSDETVLADLPD